MAKLINVPYSRQVADDYCLPACAQMALAHLGISRSQQELACQMGIVHDFGVPASQLIRLRAKQIEVLYATEGDIVLIRTWLDRQIPVILCVATSELAY